MYLATVGFPKLISANRHLVPVKLFIPSIACFCIREWASSVQSLFLSFSWMAAILYFTVHLFPVML